MEQVAVLEQVVVGTMTLRLALVGHGDHIPQVAEVRLTQAEPLHPEILAVETVEAVVTINLMVDIPVGAVAAEAVITMPPVKLVGEMEAVAR